MTRSATLRTRMIPRISMIRRAMSRGMAIVALGVLACALGACQTVSTTGGGVNAAPARLQHMLDSGELRVGLSGSQPPLNMKDRQGNLIGLEVDIVKALASAMGLEPKFRTMPFAELLPALEKGELAIGGESWKCDEVDEMAFDNQHIQQVVRARCGDEEGVGVLEQICFGPHARYGFKEPLDPAS